MTRRSFLRATAAAPVFSSLVSLRAAPMALAAERSAGLTVLTDAQAELLTQIAARMVESDDPRMPAVHETEAIAVIDRALEHTPEDLRAQVGWLLWLFDWGPLVVEWRLATFGSLTPTEQDDYIRGWATSRMQLRRMGFQALKNLSMLGYYTQDATWRGIGYDGPWTSRRPVEPIVGRS